jgi:hypothetical protein
VTFQPAPTGRRQRPGVGGTAGRKNGYMIVARLDADHFDIPPTPRPRFRVAHYFRQMSALLPAKSV